MVLVFVAPVGAFALLFGFPVIWSFVVGTVCALASALRRRRGGRSWAGAEIAEAAGICPRRGARSGDYKLFVMFGVNPRHPRHGD